MNKNKYKLRDVTKSIFDGKHGGCNEAINSGYYFISVKDIVDGKIDYDNAKQINKEDFDQIYKRTKLEPGDTIYANSGDTIGKILYIRESEFVNRTAFQKSIAVLKPNEKIDSKFMYYLLMYETPGLRNVATGSAQKNLLLDTMRNYEIEIPEIVEQKKISKVLFDIDEKIANNKKIINEIEQIDSLMYDYWFLQFDFPNSNGKPYKDNSGTMVMNNIAKKEIPEKWTCKKLSELLDVKTGKKDANFSTENGKYNFFTCSKDVLKCDEYDFEGKAVLIAGNGDFNVKYYNGKFNAYQRTYVLQLKEEKYIGLIYQSAIRKIDAFKKGSNGSIVKFITKGDIDNIDIIIPDNDKYIEIFNKNLEVIQEYKNENEQLKKLRDFLLPLLMNGQVTFKDL